MSSRSLRDVILSEQSESKDLLFVEPATALTRSCRHSQEPHQKDHFHGGPLPPPREEPFSV
jgi:hypothetical protein